MGRLMKKIQCQSTLGERAAEQQANRAATYGDEDVGAHRPGPRQRLGELGHDDGADHRGRNRAADALDETRGNQQRLVVGEAAHRRRGGENHDAAQEDAFAAQQVAQAAGQQQEAAERDEVGIHEPGQVGLGEVEVGLDGR
jgi:hypothetical protein